MTMNDLNKEYAEALFALACENNSQTEFSHHLNSVAEYFEKFPEYQDLLTSPAIPLNERLQSIDSVFGNSLPEYVHSFLKILCERKRIHCFSECVSEYDSLLDAYSNVAIANVSSAIALSEDQLSALKLKLEKMSGKSVLIQCTTDPQLIGGIVVEIDGKVIDGSLRRSLNDVKEVIGK